MKKIVLAVAALLMVFVLAACDETLKEADLNTVMADIEKNVTLPEMMNLTADNLSDYGIDASDAKQFVFSIDKSGIKADEVAMLEAKDADAAARIKEKLEAHLTERANQFNNYLPEEYAIVEQCSVETYGNYVTMFVSSDASKMIEIFESYVK
mgnify:CR=1 FL=1